MLLFLNNPVATINATIKEFSIFHMLLKIFSKKKKKWKGPQSLYLFCKALTFGELSIAKANSLIFLFFTQNSFPQGNQVFLSTLYFHLLFYITDIFRAKDEVWFSIKCPVVIFRFQYQSWCSITMDTKCFWQSTCTDVYPKLHVIWDEFIASRFTSIPNQKRSKWWTRFLPTYYVIVYQSVFR